MTPQYQFAESTKYSARPVVIIPTEAGFILFEAYGTTRDYIVTIPSGELARWMEEDFARQRSRRAATKPRPPIVDLDLDSFDFVL